jgi:hypothetical protein
LLETENLGSESLPQSEVIPPAEAPVTEAVPPSDEETAPAQ